MLYYLLLSYNKVEKLVVNLMTAVFE